MKRSEIIKNNYETITEAMLSMYRTVLESNGRIQYKIYFWDDGEIECLEQVQGDSGYLQPRDMGPRALHYVTTIEQPNFDPWDSADHSAPEDEQEREAEEAEIIDRLVQEYETNVSDELDIIIREAEMDERYDSRHE